MTRVEAQPKRTAASVVGNILLNVAAAGGVVCIVLVILAFFFNITLIMFKTGSMTPTIPAGSLAVVREIPVSEVKVGDVVTVDRPGVLPVTHRVVAIEEADNVLSLRLKGDANLSEDPAPYTVATVRIVLASVPGLAYVVVWFSNPAVLGALTIGASVLVTWAFWPRNPARRRRGRDADAADDSDDAADSDAVTAAGDAHDHVAESEAARLLDAALNSESSTGSRRTGSIVVLSLIAGVAACLSPVLSPQTANAAPTEQRVTGEHLDLTSIGDLERMADLSPGTATNWEVGVGTHTNEPGTITVSLSGSGSSELGLVTRIRSCTTRWSGATCPGTTANLSPVTVIAVDGVKRELFTMPADEERWILFDVSIPATADAAEGTVALTVTAVGIGEEIAVSPGPIRSLPRTGADPMFAVFAAIGAVIVGLALAGIASMTRRQANARELAS